MKSNHEFDKFLRNEINTINHDGAEAAWESFSKGVGRDVLQYKGEKNYLAYTRYLSLLLILIGCFGLYAFVNFEQADNQQPLDHNSSIIKPNSLQPNSLQPSSPSNVLPSKNVKIDREHNPQKQEVESNQTIEGPIRTKPREQTDQIIAASHSNAEDRVLDNRATLTDSQIRPSITLPKHEISIAQNDVKQVSLSNDEYLPSYLTSSASELQEAMLIEDLDALSGIPLLASQELITKPSPMMGKIGQVLIPIKKRSLRLFGEVGISNQNAGVKLLAGISIPLGNTLDLELGAGINSRIGDKDIISLNFDSQELPNYKEEHTYAISQLMNFMAPIRIKKSFKKHSFLVGGQLIRNVTNSVELNSTTPYRSFAAGDNGIKIADVTYLYQNSRNAVNNYSVVTSTEWNFEMTGGYEYQAGRFGIGVQVSKPVAPSFKLFSRQSDDLLYQAKTPINFGINLKYYI